MQKITDFWRIFTWPNIGGLTRQTVENAGISLFFGGGGHIFLLYKCFTNFGMTLKNLGVFLVPTTDFDGSFNAYLFLTLQCVDDFIVRRSEVTSGMKRVKIALTFRVASFTGLIEGTSR